MRYDDLDINMIKSVLLKEYISTSRSSDSITKKFENDFASLLDTKYALAVSSGTAGLHLALLSCGVKPGDEVIVDPLFQFGAFAALYCKAIPVFYDVDLVSYMPTETQILERISEKTKAVIITNIFGCMPNYNKIKSVCEKYNLFLIEDCAHSILCRNESEFSGCCGDIGVFSFQSTKHLSLGDGGMIITENETLYRNAVLLHSHGTSANIIDEYGANLNIGWMYRISELVSAVGVAQLEKINKVVAYHKMIGELLTNRIISTKIIPQQHPYSDHVYWRWAAIVEDPALFSVLEDRFQGNALVKFGINRKKTVNDSVLFSRYYNPNDFCCPYDCIFSRTDVKNNIVLTNAQKVVNNLMCIKIVYGCEPEIYERIADEIIKVSI